MKLCHFVLLSCFIKVNDNDSVQVSHLSPNRYSIKASIHPSPSLVWAQVFLKMVPFFGWKRLLGFSLLVVTINAHPNEYYHNGCKLPSVTTASGSAVKKSSFCSGELIFEDNFNKLDLEKWQHEHTLGGGGVSIETARL